MRTPTMSQDRCCKVALYLLQFAPQLLPLTPCSVFKVSQSLVRLRAVKYVQQGVEDILFLARECPNTVVVEFEKVVDSSLIFYYVEGLQAIVNGGFSGSTSPAVLGTSLSLRELEMQPVPFLTTLRVGVTVMVNAPTTMERRGIEEMKASFPKLPVTKFCSSPSYKDCIKAGRHDCKYKIHFEKVETAHNDDSDCSYLDACFKGKQCKFAHYKIRYPSLMPEVSLRAEHTLPMQYINANLLELDLGLLGHDYAALIIDPPWDIHTRPGAHGVCNDEAVMKLTVEKLQHDGVVFLWVTGRVLEFGRQCLSKWGYDHIEELIWIKTNQLGKTICTGRTGHWLNHTKEHVLIGSKKHSSARPGRIVDTDVLVSNSLGRSQKPEELYGIIDRLVGSDKKKLELFGRKENCRPGWLTIGNEIGSTRIIDPDLYTRLFGSHS